MSYFVLLFLSIPSAPQFNRFSEGLLACVFTRRFACSRRVSLQLSSSANPKPLFRFHGKSTRTIEPPVLVRPGLPVANESIVQLQLLPFILKTLFRLQLAEMESGHRVSPSTPANLFASGEAYKQLHQTATLHRPPVSLEADEYAVGLVQNDKGQDISSIEASDILWFKVKASKFTSHSMPLTQRSTNSSRAFRSQDPRCRL